MRRLLAASVLSILAVCVASAFWLWLNVQSQTQPSLVPQPNSALGGTNQTGSPSAQNQASLSGQNATSSHPQPPSPPPAPTIQSLPVLTIGNSNPSVARLQQMLAELGYLPLTWTPDKPESKNMQEQIQAGLQPPHGTWQWQKGVPSGLQSMWKPGVYNVMTQGAVMAFQQAEQLEQDGVAGPKVWSALIQSTMHQEKNPHSYSYVTVSMKQPETLQIWSGGKTILTTPANTGIPEAPTTVGTFPVYLQYRSQTMSGTTPSGEHYSDPGIPWVSYFYGGEAIHGFVRPGYGYPQSLGCVELPLQKAEQAWQYIHIGTLVTISR